MKPAKRRWPINAGSLHPIRSESMLYALNYFCSLNLSVYLSVKIIICLDSLYFIRWENTHTLLAISPILTHSNCCDKNVKECDEKTIF